MSASATRTFLPTLRRLDGELAVPLPDRLSILRELEGDLEQLTRTLVSQGHREEDAHTMALEALVPEGSTLGELSRIHASAYTRLTRRLGGPRLQAMERTTLVVATTGVLAFETAALFGTELRHDPSPFLWPVLALSGLLFAAIAAKGFGLWIKRDHRDPGRGIGRILALSGVVLATGFGGSLTDLYVLAGLLERAPEMTTTLVLQWLTQDSVLLSVSILAALAGGLTWFVLTQWLTALTAARDEVLGLHLTPKTQGDTS